MENTKHIVTDLFEIPKNKHTNIVYLAKSNKHLSFPRKQILGIDKYLQNMDKVIHSRREKHCVQSLLSAITDTFAQGKWTNICLFFYLL